MKTLTVLYDEGCPLCVRCRDWLLREPALVRLELLPAGSAAARDRYGEVPWLGEELVVVADDGRVWVGAAAFIVCLWALDGYREWSFALAQGSFSSVSSRFFDLLSSKRRTLGRFLRGPTCASDRCHALSRSAPAYR